MRPAATAATGRILGIDTDVLIHWAMSGAPHHRSVRHFLTRSIQAGNRLGISQQTLFELLHVVTDARRFEQPLTMPEALQQSREIWFSQDVVQLRSTAEVFELVCEQMELFRLGRKRILDTVLAATLRVAGISDLVTLNGRDFEIFPFLEVVDPTTAPG